MFCGLRLRRQTVLIVCLFAALFAAGVALATVGKFSGVTSSATLSTSTTAAAAALTSSGPASAAALSGTTTDPTTLTATLTVNFTESGLGNVGETDHITATVDALSTTYFCINRGSNQPKASNKATFIGPVLTSGGDFPVDHNGKITGTLSLDAHPADPGTFACPSGQTESVFMTFSGIHLLDSTIGSTGTAPDATTNTVALG
jgi:hypothetical protein